MFYRTITTRPCGLSAILLMFLLLFAADHSAAQEGGATGAQSLVTLDADGTSVSSVLQILAQRSGLNIVTGPSVQERIVSIHLQETPFEEALQVVVRAAGLGYERVGNSIVVSDRESLALPSESKTRVFDLQYVGADEVRPALEVLTKDVTAQPSANRVIVKAGAATLEQVARVIADLDRKPEQIVIDARLIEVNATSLKDVGIDWEKITRWNSVITEGNQGTSAKGSVPDEISYVKIDHGGDYYRQMQAIEVAVDALITDGRAKTLANSRVVTVDGRAAEIFAGETVPVVITSLASGGGAGVLQTVQLEKIDVGVKLRIVPRVSEDGTITTIVEPEVSRIVAFVGPDNDLPQTSTRRARSMVRVRNGEKIYLGGLLSEEKRQTVKKVPILGSIPLLGYFFRHYRDDTSRTDLVIEITPRVIGDDGAYRPANEEQ